MVIHEIKPVFNKDSKILILGSFPSVKSREGQFFYHHPQNRFWKILSALYNETMPISIEDKKTFLLTHHIALWDVIHSCTITGSSDSSIKDVVINDITPILKETNIRKIYTNGNTADTLYKKYMYPNVQIKAIKLPSSSPANARFTLDMLIEDWKIIKE